MRALILAYDFPPYVSVGGLRPYAWYRYLHEHGVHPVVVTRQWAHRYGDERDYLAPGTSERTEVEEHPWGTLLRTPYRPHWAQRLYLRRGPDAWSLPRRAFTAAVEVAQYHLPVGPQAGIYRGARAWLREHRVDVIVATGGPFTLHLHAAALSKEFGVPWIADYRDPWSQDLNATRSPLWRRWQRAVEVRTQRRVAAITTPAESFARRIGALHPRVPVRVVPNGYDPEAWEAARDVPQGAERLTIAFVGTVYAWYPMESVLRVLDALVRERPDAPLDLHFIGVGGQAALEETLRARFPALAARTRFTPRLPNERMAGELARANALLLFNTYEHPATKIYDYLAARRRILFCYTDDAEALALRDTHYWLDPDPSVDLRMHERLVEETRSGVTVRDAAHLREVLDAWIVEFRAKGALPCEPVGVERYSRRAQTGLLAEVIREVAG